MTSIMVSPEIYDRFIEILPRRKSVGEALREYMQSVVEEHDKEKKVNPQPRGALINIIATKSNKDFENKQMMLDLWKHIVFDDRDKIADCYSDLPNISKRQFEKALSNGLELVSRMIKK